MIGNSANISNFRGGEGSWFFLLHGKNLLNADKTSHIYENEQLVDIKREVKKILSQNELTPMVKNKEIQKLALGDDYLQRQRDQQFMPVDMHKAGDGYSKYGPDTDPSISFVGADYEDFAGRIVQQYMDRVYSTFFPGNSLRTFFHQKSQLHLRQLKEEVLAFEDAGDTTSVTYKEVWETTFIASMILFQSTTRQELYEGAEALMNVLDTHVGRYTYSIRERLQHELRDGASARFETYVWQKILAYGYRYYNTLERIYTTLQGNPDEDELHRFSKHLLAHYNKPPEESAEELLNIKILFEGIVENAANTNGGSDDDVIYE